MVRFNELRITEDRKCLIVDCEIERVGLYSDMYIESIYVDYYKFAGSFAFPTDKGYLLYEKGEDDIELKAVRTSMNEQDLLNTQFGIETFEDGLFFVTVVCGGDPRPQIINLPCGSDSYMDTQAVIDWKGFYERGMGYISALYSGCGDKCSIPAGFEDFVLLWNAFKAAIASCDWPMVVKLWDRILRSRLALDSSCGRVISDCGCGK